jgi:hypothetical protein
MTSQLIIFGGDLIAIDSLSPDDPELQNIVIKKLYDFIKASSKMQHLVKQIKLEESARAGNN